MPNVDSLRKDILQQQSKSSVGFITKVFEHNDPEDKSNHEVNVQLTNRDEEYRRIPVHTNKSGGVYVPKKNDFVEVGFIGGKTNKPYVAGFAHDIENRAPLGRSGHWRQKFEQENDNDLYIEAERSDHDSGSPNVVRFAVKEDGLSDPVARIELDSSGSDTTVRLTRGESEQDNTDMGIELNFGSGEFKIGDGSGYGIESDGNGNFTWYENSVNFVDDGRTLDW